MSRQDATDLLMSEREGGVFLVRDSATIQVFLKNFFPFKRYYTIKLKKWSQIYLNEAALLSYIGCFFNMLEQLSVAANTCKDSNFIQIGQTSLLRLDLVVIGKTCYLDNHIYGRPPRTKKEHY